MRTRNKVLIGFGVYLLVIILLAVLFGNAGKNDEFQPQNEFKLPAWVNIKVCRHRPVRQPGGPLPVPWRPCSRS